MPIKMSRIEIPVRLALAYYKAYNAHDVAAMIQLMSENCIVETSAPAPDGIVYSGKEAVTKFWQDFFHESPHANIKIEDVYGLGKRCIARWKCTWVDSDGKQQQVRGAEIFRTKDGLICEQLSYVKS